MHIRSRFPHYHGDVIPQAVELQMPGLLMTQASHAYICLAALPEQIRARRPDVSVASPLPLGACSYSYFWFFANFWEQ